MRKNLLFCLFIALFSFISCESNEDLITDNEYKISGTETFIYNGIKYQSDFYYDSNSQMKFTNKDVQEIADKLKNIPNLTSIVHPDLIIEYIDDANRFEEYLKTTTNIDQLTTRASNGVRFYDAAKCKGRSFFVATGLDKGALDDIKDDSGNWVNLNDQLSSLYIYGKWTRAILYSERYFDGYSIYFSSGGNTYGYIHYFSSYRLYPGGPNWNDKVRSVATALF